MGKRVNSHSSSILLDFVASGSAAALSKTVVAPVERLKLFYQVQKIHPSISATDQYRTWLDFFTRISRQQGVVSLWRGNFANILRYLPVQSLNFVFNNQYKKMFGPKTSNAQALMFGLLSGGMAGVSSLTIVYPLDYIRTRMAVDNGQKAADREFRGLADCARKTYKNQGVFGFYRGYTAGITFYFIYRASYFGFYEFIKKMFAKSRRNEDLNVLLRFSIAEFVSLTSQSVVYPLDTVRRRMMMQDIRGKSIYKNNFHCWRQIFAQEGFRGFYSGLTINAFRSIGAALMLTLYDEIVIRLHF